CPRFRCSCLSVREGVIEVPYRATPWMLFPHMPTLQSQRCLSVRGVLMRESPTSEVGEIIK
ncbi:unnamed protein product, partial [Arabidopsis halleri]